MDHKEKIDFMIKWCHKNKVRLELEGKCGFGRECVGITSEGTYPDYQWDNDDYERIDNNGDVWIPEDAYHKHTCVAVLGRGENAESQLYDWIKWFDHNNFTVEVVDCPENINDPVLVMMGRHKHHRMIKKPN